MLAPDRIDDDMRPEARAILPDAPAFRFETAFLRGRPQGVAGQVRGAILVGIEPREMLADDLVVRIALEPLRATVPARHLSLRIEHVDGVIVHTLDEQAEMLLALPERGLGGVPLGEVARDLGIAEEGAVLIADRVDEDMGPHQASVLADAPSLLLESPLGRGDLQRAAGKIGGPVVVGVEPREMLADDLRVGIAFEALGAAIPARHPTLDVEHVDGVVDDALNQ